MRIWPSLFQLYQGLLAVIKGTVKLNFRCRRSIPASLGFYKRLFRPLSRQKLKKNLYAGRHIIGLIGFPIELTGLPIWLTGFLIGPTGFPIQLDWWKFNLTIPLRSTAYYYGNIYIATTIKQHPPPQTHTFTAMYWPQVKHNLPSPFPRLF